MTIHEDYLHSIVKGFSNYVQTLFTYKKVFYEMLTILIKEYNNTLDQFNQFKELLYGTTKFRMLHGGEGRAIFDPMVEQVKRHIDNLYENIAKIKSPVDLLKLLINYGSVSELHKIMLIHNLLYIYTGDTTSTSEDHGAELYVGKFDRLQYLPPILFNMFMQHPEYFERFDNYIRKSSYSLWRKMFEVVEKKNSEILDIASKAIFDCKVDADFHEQAERLLKALNLNVNVEVRGSVANLLRLLREIHEYVKKEEDEVKKNKVKTIYTVYDALNNSVKYIPIGKFIAKSVMANILEFNLSNILVAYGILPLTNVYLTTTSETYGSQETELDVFANIPIQSDGTRIEYVPVVFECKLYECEKVKCKESIKVKAETVYEKGGVFIVLCSLKDRLLEFIDEGKMVFVNSSALTVPEIFIGLLYHIVYQRISKQNLVTFD